MVTIDINKPIGPEAENRWFAMWGEDNVVFSLETIKKIFEDNKEETDFKFNINCDGGYVDEGLAIYDYIRTSGKNIHCNIEAGCHSMAIVMLLAAPANQRTANKHARSLIHCVRAEMWGDKTADELREMADYIDELEDKILDIYVDRTGRDKETLKSLMHEEKMRDAQFLLDNGFINSINAYNTNSLQGSHHHTSTNQNQQTNMAKSIKEALEMAQNWLAKAKDSLGGEEPKNGPTATNYDHKDADGNVLFTTEAEDATIEVGMTASPNGTFELPDGRKVVISDGAITDIQEKSQATEDTEELQNLRNQLEEAKAANEALTNSNAELTTKVTEMQSQMDEMTNQLNQASEMIEELTKLSSNYKPKATTRTANVNTPKVDETHEEHLEAQRARLGIKTANKKED